MAKQINSTTIAIIIAIVALIIFAQPGGPGNTADNIQNFFSKLSGGGSAGSNTGTDPNTDFISVRLYDKEARLIENPGTFSIVQGISGVYFVDITITAENTGAKPLSCIIASLSPTPFDEAIPIKDARPAPINGKVAWTSDLIPVTQFEAFVQPVEFSASVRCSYSSGEQIITLGDKTGQLPLNIIEDLPGSFDVSVETGGLGNEYCGDGTCQFDEDTQSCPDDCALTNYVNFRTTDLSYVSGSAIGYVDGDQCSEVLLAAGYVTSGSVSSSGTASCEIKMPNLGYQLQLSGLPGGWKSGYSAPSLWKDASDPTRFRICQDKAGSSSMYYKTYDTDDSDAGDIDTNPLSFNIAKEVAC